MNATIKVETTDASTTLSLAEVSVRITQRKAYGEDRQVWECNAFLCGEWHGHFAGKTYKTPVAADRAAKKWLTEKAAQLATDSASYAKHKDAPKGPTPDWLTDVFEQLETTDVATVIVKV